MKCPLLSAPTARTAFQEHFADVDCLKEKCAWWYQDGARCCILDICLTLNTTDLTLQDISEKLPVGGKG